MGHISVGEKLKRLFGFGKKIDDEFFEDLTDTLIEGDIGAKNAVEFVDILEKQCREEKITDPLMITKKLKDILSEYVQGISFEIDPSKTNVFMVLGVNGVGKTTSCAKMAKLFSEKNINVVMAASDTFRAAAVDQIAMHGDRLNIRVVKHQMGSDPSAVVFDAADAVRSCGGGLVIADTAGRLHNKENLVNELKKIDRIASSKADEGCYKKILVIDGTTGQNAVRQAEVFHEAVGVDAVILTKYDSTAKGGEVITIAKELNIPVLFVCTGEGYGDINSFDREEFLKEFTGC